MTKKFNVENCDILNENGHLRLVYNDDDYAYPLTLISEKSYRKLNEKAAKLFGEFEWIIHLIKTNVAHHDSILAALVADIYASDPKLYDAAMNSFADDEEDEFDDEDSYELSDCLTLTATDEKDERGHRMGCFDVESLKNLDTDMLRALADALGIEDFDTATRIHLIFAIHEKDIDMDDSACDYDCEECECGEMTEDGNCICHYEGDDEDTVSDEENSEATVPDANDSKGYEYVDGPAHYHGTECIENMRHLYGDEAVKWFCICNAYKYRFRDGSKPGVSSEQDRSKADWYERYAAKMMAKQYCY